ncbi:hypothetical protein A5875_003337, partial [Enterococcus sp. 3H8_DIV0648]
EGSGKIITTAYAVSYTHLDVYKRTTLTIFETNGVRKFVKFINYEGSGLSLIHIFFN